MNSGIGVAGVGNKAIADSYESKHPKNHARQGEVKQDIAYESGEYADKETLLGRALIAPLAIRHDAGENAIIEGKLSLSGDVVGLSVIPDIAEIDVSLPHILHSSSSRTGILIFEAVHRDGAYIDGHCHKERGGSYGKN